MNRFLLILLLAEMCTGDLFASMSEMESLVETEQVLIADLEMFVEYYEEVLGYLKRKSQQFQNEFQEMSSDVEKYLSNPLNAYLLIKRMTVDIDNILHAVDDLKDEFAQKSKNNKKNLTTANEEDLKGAVTSVLRLQEIYLLNTTDLADGVIDGVKYRESLTTHDCFEIGKWLNRDQKYEYAISWLNEALFRHSDFDELETPYQRILEALAVAHSGSGTLHKATSKMQQLVSMDAESEMAQDLYLYAGVQSAAFTNTLLKTVKPKKEVKETILHRKVCRGDIAQNVTELSSLKCFYVRNTTAFVKIAPIKVEQASHQPYVLVFHDVLYDSEIDEIKNMSKSKFTRSMVKSKERKSVVSESRLSKISWLYDGESSAVLRVSNRVTDMTGLSMGSAEALQIQNYGIGGHYNCHLDYFQNPNRTADGDRIATTLFYMSTVEKGGATVFPYLKIRVQPVKGNALFWYNISPSGHGEWLTRHSACPVLVGIKWAANKWIHETGQEFRRPCGLNPDTTPMDYERVLREIGI